MSGNESIALIIAILTLSIAVDLIFGELPVKIHPVVFIGKLIDFFSKYLINVKSRITGIILTILVSIITIFIFLIIMLLASFNTVIFIIVCVIILSSTFSIKMLLSSARQIKHDLESGINVARKSMSYLVSRNTDELGENLIISATIETLSENITDSVLSPIFYYILTNIIIIIIFISIKMLNPMYSIQTWFSIPFSMFLVIVSILVAMFYRLINTLDAMVGYKNEKCINIGYFPARLDDILNYIPSRFGGITVVLASKLYKNSGMDWKNSYMIMKRDARNSPSPNSGFTIAAVAGALGISLEKKGVYIIGGNNVANKNYNHNKPLNKEDIEKSIKLSKLSIYLAIIFLASIFLIVSTIMMLNYS